MNTNGRHNFKSLYYKFRYSKLPRLQFGSVTWSSARRSWLPSARTAFSPSLCLSWSHLCVFLWSPHYKGDQEPSELAGRSLCSRSCCGKKKGPCGAKMWAWLQPEQGAKENVPAMLQKSLGSDWEQKVGGFQNHTMMSFILKSIKHCHLTISEILEYHVEIIWSKQTTKKKL